MKKELSQEQIDFLRSSYSALLDIEFFSGLTKEELIKFCTVVDEERFSKNTVISEEGKLESKLYIISKGIVEISKKTALGEPYVISILNENGNGAFFGEVSLIEEQPRTATTIAKTDLITYTITGEVFTRFCDINPAIGYKIMKIMSLAICRHLRESNDSIMVLFNALVEETERGIGY